MRILSRQKTEQRMNNQQMNKEMGVQGSHSPRQRSKVELTKSKTGGLYESDLPGDSKGKVTANLIGCGYLGEAT